MTSIRTSGPIRISIRPKIKWGERGIEETTIIKATNIVEYTIDNYKVSGMRITHKLTNNLYNIISRHVIVRYVKLPTNLPYMVGLERALPSSLLNFTLSSIAVAYN